MDEERKDCTIFLTINENGAVKVEFKGRHINKRELLRAVKAIKVEHRETIRRYRQNMHLKIEQDSKKNVIKIGNVIVKEMNHD